MKRPVKFCAATLLGVSMLAACSEDDPAPTENGDVDTTSDEEVEDIDEEEDDIDEEDDEDLDEDGNDETDETENADADEDTAAADEPEMMEESIDIVFYDDQVLDMYRETHTISGAGQEGLAQSAIEQWIEGPNSDELISIIEEDNVSVQYVEDHDGVAHVSFSPEFADINVGSGFEIGIMDQIAYLVQQAGFDSVLVLIDGESADTLFGHVDSSTPHEPETSLEDYEEM
ncbi:GerMN domain-containing protein [Geomicrobium sp. JCM 19037]|uniref:GerMN domain-containing protein n=1 Tax=Geomicrobium sp. JCM 19037 TaxID=1460634 RepID=UPI000693719C|nr:GerMN domain-containing protein [Geomicrobium sp. JCM 19037]